MPTLADFQADAPRAQPAGDFVPIDAVQPDITKHDPNTFAGLTAQSALSTMYQQGLSPTGDDIKGVYTKALDDANSYHSHLAEEQERSQLQLKTRAAAVQSGVLSAEETARAQVEMAKQQQMEQWKETGEIHRAAQPDIDRINGFESGYQTADKLQKYHYDMAATTPGAGGVLKEHLMGWTAPDLTSQETRDFNAYLESSIVPLGKGIFGDAATAATKDTIQTQMRDMLANKGDNPIGAGHKTFMLKDRIMQNLITDRNNAEANHVDTTPWDKAIGRLSTDYNSQATRQYAPHWTQGNMANPVVQNGTSTVGTATMDTQLIQSAQQQQQQANQPIQQGGPNLGVGQGNQDWSGSSGVYSTAPVSQQTPARTAQEAAATQNARALVGTVSQTPSRAINWLQGLLPENWNQSAFPPQQ